jgi:hypothetical protein
MYSRRNHNVIDVRHKITQKYFGFFRELLNFVLTLLTVDNNALIIIRYDF